MALTDFFRINLPYGLLKNSKDEWFAFNREYKPLGYNNTDFIEHDKLPVFTKYKGLTDKAIVKIIKDESLIHRDEKGSVNRIFFYNDGTNPQSTPKHWTEYFEIIKAFSKFERETN